MSFPRLTAIVSATRCLCIVCKNLFSQSKKQNLLVLEIYIDICIYVVLIWTHFHINLSRYIFTSILEIGQWFFHNPVSSCAPSSHNIRISLMGRHISIAKGNVLIYRDELLSPFRILTPHTSSAKLILEYWNMIFLYQKAVVLLISN